LENYTRRPDWLKLKPLDATVTNYMQRLVRDLQLNTVCESSRCPNRTDCFSKSTATFMILGDVCTRHCAFCAVKKGTLKSPDCKEPENIVKAVNKLELRYVVITSVTRDDLADGGSAQFVRAIQSLKAYNPAIIIEVLISDFSGSLQALTRVIDSKPEVLGHNIETVPRLYPIIRPEANYRRSLEIIQKVKSTDPNILTKSGFMLGLGEEKHEVLKTIRDIKESGCDLLVIGQYLQPSLKHPKVSRYYTPDEFKEYERIALDLGLKGVLSAPLARSSWKAWEMYLDIKTDPVLFNNLLAPCASFLKNQAGQV
jgi:lipoic acid synthetase